MKKFLIAVAGWVAVTIGAPASAADVAAIPATKAPPVLATIYDWSGVYIGINGGGGSLHSCWEVVDALGVAIVPAANEGCHNARRHGRRPDRLPLAIIQVGFRPGGPGQLG